MHTCCWRLVSECLLAAGCCCCYWCFLLLAAAVGLLIGLGETRQERLADLLLIQQLQQQYGHIQEVIIQNFRCVCMQQQQLAVKCTVYAKTVDRLLPGGVMSL